MNFKTRRGKETMQSKDTGTYRFYNKYMNDMQAVLLRYYRGSKGPIVVFGLWADTLYLDIRRYTVLTTPVPVPEDCRW